MILLNFVHSFTFLRCYGDIFVSEEFNEIHTSFLGHVSTILNKQSATK